MIQYSTNKDVNATVCLFMADMEVNPYTGHVLSIAGIIEAVRYGFGDDAAETVKITVH